MSVSIIIPALNEASNLAEYLPKLKKQSNLNEIIIADGGSSDESAQIAAQHGATLCITARGRARQMNEGAKQASGDILLFLHADSELPTEALKQIQTLIDSGITWGRFNVRLSGKQWLFRVVERLINWRSCITGIATGDQGIFLKRELFESLGGYAEIPLMEDVELSKRLKKLSPPHCIRAPIITSSRRWEHHGILRTIVLMWRMRFAYAMGASPEKLAAQYRRSDIKGQGKLMTKPWMFPNAEVLVMARAPEKGKAKTRLIPALGDEGAARLHAHLVERLLASLTEASISPVTLCCTPDVSHPFFQQCREQYGVALQQQSDGDLGQRLHSALSGSLEQHEFALVVGCDIPELGAEDVIAALDALKHGYDASITPVEDGGYAMLAIKRPEPHLFEDISWGSEQVLSQTIEKLSTLNWQYKTLPQRWDVDRPEDLQRLFELKLSLQITQLLAAHLDQAGDNNPVHNQQGSGGN